MKFKKSEGYASGKELAEYIRKIWLKWLVDLNRHFSEKNMQIHATMFNITNHQRSINANHNEISPHSSEVDSDEKLVGNKGE